MTPSLVAASGSGLADFFGHSFIRYGLLAGTFIALASGLVGYLLVLRAQVFASDALGHAAYTGALAALALGVDARFGLFVATVLVGVGLAGLGRRARPDDVVIGSVFAWILGLGVFFLTIYTTSRSTANGAASVNYLFGSIFGLSASESVLAAAVAGGVCIVIILIARPLVFATVDEAVAAARGVPVRMLGIVFLALVGVTAAEAAQDVGALLLLGLMAAPGGAAQRLTTRPFVGLAVSGGIAVASTWVGVVLSYLISSLPPSSAILGVATLAYVLAALVTQVRSRGRPRLPVA
ncbi:MAG TPA: metal ABC transporter permease [Acidimicrobiales bacterium]|nr:metal ABC transporter permease [Acidimicrobiales bacterium]